MSDINLDLGPLIKIISRLQEGLARYQQDVFDTQIRDGLIQRFELWAFGSRAKGTAKEYSDLDLAVITECPLPIAVSASLNEDFSESDLPWKVDVVDWATTSDSFRKIIERDRVVLQAGRPDGACPAAG